ncbi:MAG TPA: hypothetical protein VNG33_18380, partial [Polyangiaceae bacterium]|nr:hypothetical protein [Polyangiaceae bacterium]
LPKDTRPPPAQVHMTATPSTATKSGSFDTADGWTITLDQVLVVLGRASLDGDSCSTYSEAGYTRVLTLVGAPDAQKISDSYGLGQCDFGFGVSNAESDSVLGVGATSHDLDVLRTPGKDPSGTLRGTSMLVRGSATNGKLTEAFNWSFRDRARYQECINTVDGMSVRGLSLSQDQHVDVDIVLHAEALFRTSLDPAVDRLGFDLIASGDVLFGNHDGEVTLDELGQLPLTPLELGGAFDPGDAGAPTWLTLEDYVYQGAATTVARFRDTGSCTLRSNVMRGD